MQRTYHFYAAITIFFWSLAYVLTRLALQHFSPVSLGFLRYFTAFTFLAGVCIINKINIPQKKDFLYFTVAGATGFFLYMIVFNQGQQTVNAGTASMIIATVPIITALLSQVIYKERLQNIQWLGVLVEFSGVAVITLSNGILSINRGLFWLLLAAVFLSLYNILQRKLTRTYTALQTSAYSIFLGTIMLSVFAPLSFKELAAAPPVQWSYLAVLGTFSSALAYVSWSKALERAQQISQVSNYMFLTPLITTFLGYLIADEKPAFSTVIGSLIIFTGIFIFHLGKQTDQPS